jgi:hypothetical protein
VEAERLRKELDKRILGGTSPRTPFDEKKPGPRVRFETEPGLALFALEVVRQKEQHAPLVIRIALEANNKLVWTEADFEADTLGAAGWRVWGSFLRATGDSGWPGDRIGSAPDHNTAQWGLWIGRPLLGQWVWDVRRLLDMIEARVGKLPSRVAVIGGGPAGVVALAAAGLDPRITDVVAIDSLASFITDTPYKNQRLGIMAPGMLRQVGDVAHLAALCLPRRVVIAGGVFGDGTKLSAEQRQKTFEPAAQVARLLKSADALQLMESDDIPRIVKALR